MRNERYRTARQLYIRYTPIRNTEKEDVKIDRAGGTKGRNVDGCSGYRCNWPENGVGEFKLDRKHIPMDQNKIKKIKLGERKRRGME